MLYQSERTLRMVGVKRGKRKRNILVLDFFVQGKKHASLAGRRSGPTHPSWATCKGHVIILSRQHLDLSAIIFFFPALWIMHESLDGIPM